MPLTNFNDFIPGKLYRLTPKKTFKVDEEFLMNYIKEYSLEYLLYLTTEKSELGVRKVFLDTIGKIAHIYSFSSFHFELVQ